MHSMAGLIAVVRPWHTVIASSYPDRRRHTLFLLPVRPSCSVSFWHICHVCSSHTTSIDTHRNPFVNLSIRRSSGDCDRDCMPLQVCIWFQCVLHFDDIFRFTQQFGHNALTARLRCPTIIGIEVTVAKRFFVAQRAGRRVNDIDKICISFVQRVFRPILVFEQRTSRIEACTQSI